MGTFLGTGIGTVWYDGTAIPKIFGYGYNGIYFFVIYFYILLCI